MPDQVMSGTVEKIEDKDWGKSGYKPDTPTIIALTIVIGFFVVVLIVLFVELPHNDTSKTIIAMLIGSLTASFLAIVTFYFGSSKGSKDKDTAMATIAVDASAVKKNG